MVLPRCNVIDTGPAIQLHDTAQYKGYNKGLHISFDVGFHLKGHPARTIAKLFYLFIIFYRDLRQHLF